MTNRIWIENSKLIISHLCILPLFLISNLTHIYKLYYSHSSYLCILLCFYDWLWLKFFVVWTLWVVTPFIYDIHAHTFDLVQTYLGSIRNSLRLLHLHRVTTFPISYEHISPGYCVEITSFFFSYLVTPKVQWNITSFNLYRPVGLGHLDMTHVHLPLFFNGKTHILFPLFLNIVHVSFLGVQCA